MANENHNMISVRTSKEGHDHVYGDLLKEALELAFKEHPTALRSAGSNFLEAYENRDGVPVPVTLITLRIELPADPQVF